MNPDNPNLRTDAQILREEKYVSEIEQLESDLRTSDLNRQSLWADSLKLVDENAMLKSKLKVAKENLEYVSLYLNDGHIVDEALKEIGEI